VARLTTIIKNTLDCRSDTEQAAVNGDVWAESAQAGGREKVKGLPQDISPKAEMSSLFLNRKFPFHAEPAQDGQSGNNSLDCMTSEARHPTRSCQVESPFLSFR